jgi:hypothetical protein
VALEGELRVGLRLQAGHVAAVTVTSTRPDVASALLQGRTRTEAAAAVPLMFSLCGRSQAAASRLACAAAAGLPDEGAAAPAAESVAAELLRECAWYTLLNAPRWLGEAPTAEATAAARGVLALRSTSQDEAACAAVAQATFGMQARPWLDLCEAEGPQCWARAGATAAARYLHLVIDTEAAQPPPRQPATPLLPSQPDEAFLQALAAALDADPAYSRAPTWQGLPAETGALARLQHHRLLAPQAGAAAARTAARGLARLVELAELLCGQGRPGVGAQRCADGSGLAWVHNARGLLVHRVHLDGERVQRYRIVAPTEWNFHPRGALAAGLLASPADSADTAVARATRLVHSLDPCVACRVEIDHA